MTQIVAAQIIIGLIIAQSMLLFAQSGNPRQDSPKGRSWRLFAEAKEPSAEEERARLARKAQSFWQGTRKFK